MQMYEIKEDANDDLIYMRSKITENQEIITKMLKIVMLNDITTQKL
jgi:hypothetical protein